MAALYLNQWNEVSAILQNNTALKLYMTMSKQFFEGARQDYITYPIIVLEPRNEEESTETLGGRVSLISRIAIYGAVKISTYEKSVVGDGANNRGILQHSANIKNAIAAYPLINYASASTKYANYIDFESTKFEAGKFPVRAVEIILRITKLVAQTGR